MWNTQAVAPSRYNCELRRLGHLGALESGLARRHAGFLLPQRHRHPAADHGDARLRGVAWGGACTAIGGIIVAPGACIINPKATSVADLTQKWARRARYNTAYGDNIHIMGVTLSKNIGGISVGAEVSYRQNMPLLSEQVLVLPAPLVPLFPGSIATTAVPTNGTPGALGDTYHGIVNALWTVVPRLGAVGQRDVRGGADLDALGEGDAERGGVQGPRQLSGQRSTGWSRDFVGIAFNVTPTWFQVWPGVDLLAADVLFARLERQRSGVRRRQRGGRQLRGGASPPTSTRSTGSI